MEGRKIQESMIEPYHAALLEAEKSTATVEKYLRSVQRFVAACAEQVVDKALVLAYKAKLGETYAPSSANAALAAVNGFLRYWGLTEDCVKPFKVQKKVYCLEEKELRCEEYVRLVNAAKETNNERMAMALESICATGIRVSELPYITVISNCNNPLYANLYHQAQNTMYAGLYEESIMLFFACIEATVHYWSEYISKLSGIDTEYEEFEKCKSVCRDCSLFRQQPEGKGVSILKLPPSIRRYPTFLRKHKIINKDQEKVLRKLIIDAQNDNLRNDMMHGKNGSVTFYQVEECRKTICRLNEQFLAIANKYAVN